MVDVSLCQQSAQLIPALHPCERDGRQVYPHVRPGSDVQHLHKVAAPQGCNIQATRLVVHNDGDCPDLTPLKEDPCKISSCPHKAYLSQRLCSEPLKLHSDRVCFSSKLASIPRSSWSSLQILREVYHQEKGRERLPAEMLRDSKISHIFIDRSFTASVPTMCAP